MAGLIFGFTGPMFSGKTTKLLMHYERKLIAGEKSALFKPLIDKRYGNDVKTHFGYGFEAFLVKDSGELLERVKQLSTRPLTYLLNQKQIKLEGKLKNVFIDEIQFFDSGIIEVILNLRKELNIYWSGLNQDYTGKPFYFRDRKDHIGTLMAYSDDVDFSQAVCAVCGRDATKTFRKRKIKGNPLIVIGGSELYEARCVDHYY